MTTDQKNLIDQLRKRGLGYKRISKELELNPNTVKAYCRRHPIVTDANTTSLSEGGSPFLLCKQCKTIVEQTPGRKAKLFCSDSCRHKWWYAHADQNQGTAQYSYVCPTCGKNFRVYGNRNYCSHACYIEARFGDAPTNNG